MMRWLNGVGYIVIDLDPGIWVGSIDQCPDQTLRQVVVAGRDLRGWDAPKPKEDFGPIDPVVASEALAALVKATARPDHRPRDPRPRARSNTTGRGPVAREIYALHEAPAS
jgi:hypothetical protein